MKVRAVFDADNPYLSPKETETLARLAEGLSRDEVAAMKFRARSTVNAQINSVLNKLDASNLVQAVAIATIKGILRYEQVLCLCLVVMLGGATLLPSAGYAGELAADEQPFLRYRHRAPSRLRTKLDVHTGKANDF